MYFTYLKIKNLQKLTNMKKTKKKPTQMEVRLNKVITELFKQLPGEPRYEALAANLGVTKVYLSQMKNGLTPLTSEFVATLIRYAPTLNDNYIYKGTLPVFYNK